jgi:DNA-binding CsgD family transcriptional regulator
VDRDGVRPGADPALWSEALASVADHIGSIAGMLIYNAPPGGKNLIVLARLNPDLVEIFHQHHVWNLWTLAMKDQPFNRATIPGSLVEHRVIQKTGFYADVLAPQRTEDTLNISYLVAATALQSAFGLTAAEARVATLIGSGLSGPQTAQVLGVAPATVKTHLARCLEKLGVHSQVELARVLSALPPDRANFDSMT